MPSIIATNRDAAAASPTPASVQPSLEEQIAHEVAALQELGIHELRLRWRKLFRTTAAEHLPRYLLFKIIAYKIQANAFSLLTAVKITRRFVGLDHVLATTLEGRRRGRFVRWVQEMQKLVADSLSAPLRT